jgi:hypothetical protein
VGAQFWKSRKKGTYLNEGNDVAARALVQLLVIPRGVLGDQPVAAAVVLPNEQSVQCQQTKVLIGADIWGGGWGWRIQQTQSQQQLRHA